MSSQRDLELTEVEAKLKRILLDVARYADSLAAKKTSGDESIAAPIDGASETIIRFTGGWVRDKVLGRESQDIDVSINNATGYQFGLLMKEYLEQPGNLEKYGLSGSSSLGVPDEKITSVGGLHKIEANPEKSKHLETVTTRILGLDIDLVNLRKETYTAESRNPQMEFGTPEDDALRRDATINALFYNLNTSSLEDLTGKGLEDMEKKVLRTPLEPYQTFKDDPLRVLRLIRFASRLDFRVHSDAKIYMSDSTIQDALRLKISRERIGNETEKMLRSQNPYRALFLIDECQLYSTIFTDPTQRASFIPRTIRWEYVYGFMRLMMKDWTEQALIDEPGINLCYITTGPEFHIDSREMVPRGPALKKLLIRNPDEEYVAWLLAAMSPWFQAEKPVADRPGGKAPPHPMMGVAREGLKVTNKTLTALEAAFRHAEEVADWERRVNHAINTRELEGLPPSKEAVPREVLGMNIRRWGTNWRCAVILGMLLKVLKKQDDDHTPSMSLSVSQLGPVFQISH